MAPLRVAMIAVAAVPMLPCGEIRIGCGGGVDDQQTPQRKLAVIVSLDVVRYSERTRRDEDVAAAEIDALSKRVGQACAAHGGRLFNAAGDGFMMAFETVSGALEAAAALAAHPIPSLRVGVHLGEVRQMPSGDLLGHGVNVAARVQGLAPPGGVMISGDARRALRGEAAGKLVDQGRFKLSRMGESVRLFSLGPVSIRARLALTARRLEAQAAVAAAAVALVAAATWLWLANRGPGDLRVAALPFEAPASDAQAQAFARGLGDEIAGTLSKSNILTVSPDRTAALRGPGRLIALKALKASLALDGAVDRQGSVLRAQARLEDAQGVTLWSGTFAGDADQPMALQTAVAAQAADMTGWALDGLRSGKKDLDPEALADFVQGSGQIVFGGADGRLKAREILRRLVARAPAFSRGHSTLAVADALAAQSDTGDAGSALKREAEAEARTAIGLDGRNGEAYLALSALAARDDWAERERRLDQGIAIQPDFPYLHNNLGSLLATMGRTRDALAANRAGMAANDLHPGANYTYAERLADTGQYAEAIAAVERLVQIAPAEWTDAARLAFAVLYGPADRARALLTAAAAHPFPNEPPAIDAWSAVLEARADGTQKSAAIARQRLLAAIDSRDVNLADALVGLSVIDQSDAAFDVIESVYEVVDSRTGGSRDSAMTALFAKSAGALRRDPRFWPLMQRVGLVDYWRRTGRKPDFCLAPAPEVGCARLAP